MEVDSLAIGTKGGAIPAWASEGCITPGRHPTRRHTPFGGGDDIDAEGHLRAPTNRHTNADRTCAAARLSLAYGLRAKDGEIVHVQGFLMDDSTSFCCHRNGFRTWTGRNRLCTSISIGKSPSNIRRPTTLTSRRVGNPREALIVRLSVDLQTRFGRGFGWANLFQMRSFYLAYRSILNVWRFCGVLLKFQILSGHSAGRNLPVSALPAPRRFDGPQLANAYHRP